jgi:Transposase
MESTGVYWIPLYDLLEERGLKPCLVNARHMKNVPGRRTDWHECQWLQYLHSVGLLRGAFRPEADVCAMRVLVRHRGELVQAASQHVQHMHLSPDWLRIGTDIIGGATPPTFNMTFSLTGATIQAAGTPGQADCQGRSASGLTEQFGSIPAAASALGFSSVVALQDTFPTFCEP